MHLWRIICLVAYIVPKDGVLLFGKMSLMRMVKSYIRTAKKAQNIYESCLLNIYFTLWCTQTETQQTRHQCNKPGTTNPARTRHQNTESTPNLTAWVSSTTRSEQTNLNHLVKTMAENRDQDVGRLVYWVKHKKWTWYCFKSTLMRNMTQ